MVSTDEFFQIFCRENADSGWRSYTFYKKYDTENIKEMSDQTFQSAVYDILGKKSDTEIKLELISRIMRNKEVYDAAQEIIPVKQPFPYHSMN